MQNPTFPKRNALSWGSSRWPIPAGTDNLSDHCISWPQRLVWRTREPSSVQVRVNWGLSWEWMGRGNLFLMVTRLLSHHEKLAREQSQGKVKQWREGDRVLTTRLKAMTCLKPHRHWDFPVTWASGFPLVLKPVYVEFSVTCTQEAISEERNMGLLLPIQCWAWGVLNNEQCK